MTLKPSAGDGSALEWTKSSYSSNDGPECIEVAATPGTVHVRDSKDLGRKSLSFPPAAWHAFVDLAAEATIAE
ncbi:DUF397 domain-containing protein [Streptomyces macrosporus]|uniref:DUF397 domain-containing protein n=1 Tax=Streptomyces macrosporus TaxID=44032 RepID=A0ABP5WZM7_9ACTN